MAPEDEPGLSRLVGRLTVRTLYQRFLTPSRVTADRYLEHLLDPTRTLDALVVLSHGSIVAVGSTHPGGSPGCAEIALLIDDAHQGEGLGTLLVEDLVQRSRRRGVTSLTALLLTGNSQIRDVLTHLGLPVEVTIDGVTSTASIDLTGGRLGEAAAERRRHAAARSLEPLLRPRTLVIVSSPGQVVPSYREAMTHLRARDPKARVVQAYLRGGGSRPAYLALRGAHPVELDLAVLVVPTRDLLAAVRASLAAGARSIMALDPDGRPPSTSSTAEARALCADGGVRLLGPRSGGLVNTDPDVDVDVGLLPFTVRAGRVCLVTASRSQATAAAGLLDVAGVGVSTLVVLGEAADVTVTDVLAFAAEDARSTLAVVCLDHLALVDLDLEPDGDRLPVVAYVADGHAVEPRPAAGPSRHVVVTRSWSDLSDAVVLLLSQPRPAGPLTAVVGTSTDTRRRTQAALEGAGLLPAAVSRHTEMRTRLVAPGCYLTGGSVTVPPGATLTQVELILRAVAEDAGVDSVICALDEGQPRLAPVLDAVSRDHPDVTLVSARGHHRATPAPARGRVPSLPGLDRAAHAIGLVQSGVRAGTLDPVSGR